MDDDNAHSTFDAPLFDATRRGYDPEQVDAYLEGQQGRIDGMARRAEKAEERLSAAMHQLRAMNARITELESRPQTATAQPSVPIDILGDRVQRILQEAWDGAFALRQSVEAEVTDLRDQASAEAQAIVDEARHKARSIEEQMRRRRDAYLARVEQDKAKAVAQMTFLSDQRKGAIAELIAIRERIEAAIVDVPTHTAATLTLVEADDRDAERRPRAAEDQLRERIADHPANEPKPLQFEDADLPPTVPVQILPPFDAPSRPADASNLVRNHREIGFAERPIRRRTDRPLGSGERVFDIEADEPRQ